MKPALAVMALLALAACGSREVLRPAAGAAMPVKPETAAATPTADQLLAPGSQAQPVRVDELLRSSQERRDDRFDLPPPG